MSLKNRSIRQRGSITIIVVALMPLLVVLLTFMVNAGIFLVARERLQIAADRAAYAGAASLTFDLNRIANLNQELKQKFDEIERHFAEESEGEHSGADKLASAAAFQADRERQMREIAQTITERAKAHATEVFAANMPGVGVRFPLRDPGDFINCFDDVETGEELRSHLSYDDVQGVMVFDPVTEKENAGGGDLVRYCNKDPRALVALGVEAAFTFRPPLLADFFGETPVSTIAAAQPFAGSLKAFSTTHDDANLYRTAIVPAASVSDLVQDEEEEGQWAISFH